MIQNPHPTLNHEIRLPHGNLLRILRLHAKARRRETPEPNPPPNSGPASPIPRSGGRSGALKPLRSGRAVCPCATASRDADHDTRRPTLGRSTHGRLGMRPDGSGAPPRAASTSPGSAYAPVADASTPRTAGSACLVGSNGNTSAPSRPRLRSRTSNAGGASWNATGQSVNGGTRNAIRRRTPSPAFAMTIDMRQRHEWHVLNDRNGASSAAGMACCRQAPSLGAKLNGSRANTRRTIGSKYSSGRVS